MKTATAIIETTNTWSEKRMLKTYMENKTHFGSGIGSFRCKAKITITIEKLPYPPKKERIYYPK